MDLLRAIGELQAERQRLVKIIENLEALDRQGIGQSPKRRGRKHMDATAREAVSRRMKRYWADRKGRDEPAEVPDATSSGNL